MKLSDQITRRHLFVAFGSSMQTGTLSSVDLAATRDGSSVTLTASDGSVAPIPGADDATAGVMTAGDKAKLDDLPPTTGQRFTSRADVESAVVGAAITHLSTSGYTAAGDGGGASYRRVGAEPAHALKVRSADGAWWELVPDPAGINVKQAGARGDGVTNDTTAFQHVAAWIEGQGGGTVIVPQGTYVVGRQTAVLNGTEAYSNEDIFVVQNCTKPVRVIGNGASIRIEDGLRMGSFDPNTGDPYEPTMPFFNYDYRVDVGFVFKFVANAFVEVSDLEINGNNTNLLLGGLWGNTGRQCTAYNIWAEGEMVSLRNIHMHHSGVDNLYINGTITAGTDDRQPVTLINIRSEYAGRQNFTWGGGKGLVCINGQFNHAGRAVNQGAGLDTGVPLNSSPAAGVDIETDGGDTIRDGLFISCEFVNNAGAGMIAFTGDTADVVFDKCLFWGTTYESIIAIKPRFRFRNCRIYGSFEQLYDPADAIAGHVHNDAPHFHDCEFEDRAWSDGNVHRNANGLIVLSARKGWLIEGGKIKVNQDRWGHLSNGVLRNVHVESYVSNLANRYAIAWAYDGVWENVYVDDLATHGTTDGYLIDIDSDHVLIDCYINSPSEKVKYYNWWTGGGGYTGPSGRTSGNNPDRVTSLRRLRLNKNDAKSGRNGIQVISGSAAPTSGTWNQGDTVLNSGAGASGAPFGWACIAAGTPGTWQELRCVGTQQAKIGDPSGGTTVDAEARTAIAAVIDVLEHFGLSSAT